MRTPLEGTPLPVLTAKEAADLTGLSIAQINAKVAGMHAKGADRAEELRSPSPTSSG